MKLAFQAMLALQAMDHTLQSLSRSSSTRWTPSYSSCNTGENAQQPELTNLQRQVQEDAEAERELQRIQAQARAAQQAQEEVIQAREAMSKHLDQSCRLRAGVELAKVVTSMLSTNSTTSSTYQLLPAATATPVPVNSALCQPNSSPSTYCSPALTCSSPNHRSSAMKQLSQGPVHHKLIWLKSTPSRLLHQHRPPILLYNHSSEQICLCLWHPQTHADSVPEWS